MRRDLRPYWLRRLQDAYARWRTETWLRPQFAALGDHPLVVGPWRVEIYGAGVEAGDHLHVFTSRGRIPRLTAWSPTAQILIGRHVLMSPGVRITAATRVKIGDGAMMASDVLISDSDWHGLYDRIDGAESSPVTIGDDVWIGDGAYVGKGVTIGDRSVIGARAVVTSDVPAGVVAAGAPARVVKRLDPDQPFRGRAALFEDYGIRTARKRAWLHRAHGAGSLLGYLRARMFPTRDD